MRAAVLLMAASTSLLGCNTSPAAASRVTLAKTAKANANPRPALRATPPSTPVTPSTNDAPPRSQNAPCPSDMILASGNYCPNPVQRCLEWLDKGHYHEWRCAKYDEPSSCTGNRRSLRFCIDRDEYAAQGRSTPLTGRT